MSTVTANVTLELCFRDPCAPHDVRGRDDAKIDSTHTPYIREHIVSPLEGIESPPGSGLCDLSTGRSDTDLNPLTFYDYKSGFKNMFGDRIPKEKIDPDNDLAWTTYVTLPVTLKRFPEGCGPHKVADYVESDLPGIVYTRTGKIQEIKVVEVDMFPNGNMGRVA